MEELQKISSRKNSEHKQNSKPSPEEKIGELHYLIKGYLNNCNVKNIENILPTIKNVKESINQKKKQLKKLGDFKVSQNQLRSYYESRNNLIEQLKQLAKSVEVAKNKTKSMRILRKQISQELKKNQQICKQLMEKNNSIHINESKLTKSTFPRISGFNYELHHTKPSKRGVSNQISGSNTARSHQKHQQQSFYNSINFLRMKQLQKLLDQITIQSHVYKIQKKLMGDPKQSVVKKVFKKFSIKQYFTQCLNDRFIYKFLQDILAI